MLDITFHHPTECIGNRTEWRLISELLLDFNPALVNGIEFRCIPTDLYCHLIQLTNNCWQFPINQMCCDRVKAAVNMLISMDNAEAILKICQEIDRLESDADRVMRSAMSKLFRDEGDVRQLIKLKAIYELLECISDKCEDVANIIEGVVLENA